MHLVLLSPPAFDPRECWLVEAMVAEGLDRYHVRKPGVTAEGLRTWLAQFSERVRGTLVLHQHHELVEEFGLLGRHWRDDGSAPARPAQGRFASRSCHDLLGLTGKYDGYQAVLAAPVFPSISKPGHGPRFGTDWLAWMRVYSSLGDQSAQRRAPVYALGGVDVSRVRACREAGFGGVAALGAVWGVQDPLKAYLELRDAVEDRGVANR